MPSEHLKQILATFTPIKRREGQPTKLTPELTDRICRLLAQGHPLRETARRVGINNDSLMEWRRGSAAFFAMTEAARNRARKAGLLRWDRPSLDES